MQKRNSLYATRNSSNGLHPYIHTYHPCVDAHLAREKLTANLATAKSELERARRLAREAAEAGKKDAEGALEKQVCTHFIHGIKFRKFCFLFRVD